MAVPVRLLGARVQVYKNLHRGDWSVRVGGKVVAHTAECFLSNVTFKVRESARQAVLAKHQRSVHAWCEGELMAWVPVGERRAVTYNPYRAHLFTVRATGDFVVSADWVHFTVSEGAVAVGRLA